MGLWVIVTFAGGMGISKQEKEKKKFSDQEKGKVVSEV
jgi:hypothetical protein